MRLIQEILGKPAELAERVKALADFEPSLILVFASVDYFSSPELAGVLNKACPQAIVLGCSTAGEISSEGVDDGLCILTGVTFDKVPLRAATTSLYGMEDSAAAGERLGQQLLAPDLKAILLFGPGTQINGSALVDGLLTSVGKQVIVSGGLAGDGGAFRQTFTLGPAGVSDHEVVALGLYGEHLRIGHGSFGGWEAFGPARKVTRCAGNILYELDGEPALAVYKRYLGDHARQLPASGLLFPFAMLGEDHAALGLIRTILGVDEAEGSLTLAGEVDANGYLKLMHASTDKLVGGAEVAAEAAAQACTGQPGLAILVSCVGRKLVMGSRVDEEVEAVAEVLGKNLLLTGFYSYGEISPFVSDGICRLHNQTMTISCLGED
ncbi:MAG: hypothetical protein D3M94_05385 [Rhodocyclales bacterium GT-UBC]|nr:MAG: hypothetical protein D3M94_05385 [Rhodocyclales bacterium GT-UBC]